jgi:hypothetical protein
MRLLDRLLHTSISTPDESQIGEHQKPQLRKPKNPLPAFPYRSATHSCLSNLDSSSKFDLIPNENLLKLAVQQYGTNKFRC